MSDPQKSYFIGKNKKNIPKCYLLNFLPRMLSIKQSCFLVLPRIDMLYNHIRIVLFSWISYDSPNEMILIKSQYIQFCEIQYLRLTLVMLNILRCHAHFQFPANQIT